MVDPRGGALTLGLGLIGPMAVIPHHDTWSEDKANRLNPHNGLCLSAFLALFLLKARVEPAPATA